MTTAPKDATEHTRTANAPVELGFDPADFERASRGLVATHPTGQISSPFGVVCARSVSFGVSPAAVSKTMTSGLPLAISVSMTRVSAGPVLLVVVMTMFLTSSKVLNMPTPRTTTR